MLAASLGLSLNPSLRLGSSLSLGISGDADGHELSTGALPEHGDEGRRYDGGGTEATPGSDAATHHTHGCQRFAHAERGGGSR